MTFIPFHDKIQIKPVERKGIIESDTASLLEKGEVIAIGRDVTFVSPGDIIFFDAWGCLSTPEGADGIKYWVVTESSGVILGKEAKLKSLEVKHEQ